MNYKSVRGDLLVFIPQESILDFNMTDGSINRGSSYKILKMTLVICTRVLNGTTLDEERLPNGSKISMYRSESGSMKTYITKP